jgi:serine/threonine protein kinase
MSDVKTIGKYELQGRIAHGGMGVVFAARNPSLDQPVAIKVLRADFTAPDAAARFEREARAASRLKHPNIVRIFDFGQDDDQWYIVMERIVGETFAQLVSRQAPLTLWQRFELFDQVCSAIGYAHQHGWIHRDLKPTNLMLDQEENLVKVLDFGLAREVEHGLTSQPAIMGSIGYMSPEQARGEPLDFRTDVFSATAVLYELLTYARAFPARGEGEPPAVFDHEPAAPSTVVTGLPPGIDDVVRKGLAKRRDDRLDSIESLRTALRAIAPSTRYDSGHRLTKDDALTLIGTNTSAAAQSGNRRWAIAAGSGALALGIAAAVAAALFTSGGDVPAATPQQALVAPTVSSSAAEPAKGHGRAPTSPVGQRTEGTSTPPGQRQPPRSPSGPAATGEQARPGLDDRRAIAEVIQRYAVAHRQLDPVMAAALRVDAPVDDLRHSFSRYREYRMTITPTGDATIDGDHASLACRLQTQLVTAQGGEQAPNDELVTFDMVRGRGSWLIARIVRH